MSTQSTVWHGRGDIYHATRSCAGQDAVPVFGEFVAGDILNPCQTCEPDERYQCDECDYVSVHEFNVRRHLIEEHQGKTTDNTERTQSREAIQRARELRKKSRRGGES